MSKHSQTFAQDLTCDETEETNRNNGEKTNNRKSHIFLKFSGVIMDVKFLCVLMQKFDIFGKKASNAIQFLMQCDCHSFLKQLFQIRSKRTYCQICLMQFL